MGGAATPAWAGQILVTGDVEGLFCQIKPKFGKRYDGRGGQISADAGAYARDVSRGRFPGLEHCYGVKPGKGRRDG